MWKVATIYPYKRGLALHYSRRTRAREESANEATRVLLATSSALLHPISSATGSSIHRYLQAQRFASTTMAASLQPKLHHCPAADPVQLDSIWTITSLGVSNNVFSEISFDHVYYLFQFEREDTKSFIMVVLKEWQGHWCCQDVYLNDLSNIRSSQER